jgi:spermidine synthase
VGFGAGTLAAYGRSSDYFRFYEIDADIVKLSKPPQEFFHYLKRCPAKVDIVEGDGRLSLAKELKNGSQKFDFLAIDAFSSDSIPAHLLTREAMDVYLQHMNQQHGILAFHISNRFLNLKPVVAGLAQKFGKQSAAIQSKGVDSVILSSLWVLVGSAETLAEISRNTSAEPASAPVLWTDDYYSMLPILKIR